MKRGMILMLAFALLMPALAVWAQEEGRPQGEGPREGPGGRPPAAMGEPQEHPMLSARFMDMIEKRLTLSAEQKAKVQETIAGAKGGLTKKFEEARKVRKEMQALEKNLTDKIRATLTDEQKTTFDQMERMRSRGPAGAGMPRDMGPGSQQEEGQGSTSQVGKGPGSQKGESQGGMDPGRMGRRPPDPGPMGPGDMGQGGGHPSQPPQEGPGGQ